MRFAQVVLFACLLRHVPLQAQINSAPEFKSGTVFQKDRSSANVDGTSHASAEKSKVNEAILSHLRRLKGYEEGVRLIESNVVPAAQRWFGQRKLPIGVAVSLFFSGNETESVRQLISIGRANPSSLTVLPFLAETALLVPSLTAPALEVVERISAKNPANGEGYYYQARLLGSLPASDDAKVVELLKRSVSLDSRATAPLIELSRLYTRSGDSSAAIESLEKVLAIHPEDSVAHYRLAALYRTAGQAEKARSHMQAFQKLQSRVQ